MLYFNNHQAHALNHPLQNKNAIKKKSLTLADPTPSTNHL